MSRTNTSPSRRKTRYPPSWWSLFYALHTRRTEEELAYYRELEQALAKNILLANKQDIPVPTKNVVSPQTGGTEGPGDTITSAEKPTSGPLNNTPDDAAQETSPDLTKESEKKSKKDKQDKSTQTQPDYNDRHKADHLPAKERTGRKSNASAHKEQSSKRNKNSPPAIKTRSVQFAVGTKKGPPSPMAYSSSSNSSKNSYIEAQKTQPSGRAEGPKSILKGKEKSIGSKKPAMKEIFNSTITESDFDSFGSDSSDEASAVDINEMPASISPRGILKNRNSYAPASVYRATSSHRYKPPMLDRGQHKSTLSKASQPGPALKNRGREKHSGFHPATTYHVGRGEQIPAHTKRMTSMRRQGHDTWHRADELESTVDYTSSHLKSQAKAQDKRVDIGLRQARSNSKLNSRSPSDSLSTSESSRGRDESRQPEDDFQRPLSSGRPIWMFRASNAAADEPDFIVSNQADLDAARRGYHRRQKSSVTASGSHRGRRMEDKAKQGRGRVADYKSDSESETSSESGDSDDSSWYDPLAITASDGPLKNANVSNVEEKPSTPCNDGSELRT